MSLVVPNYLIVKIKGYQGRVQDFKLGGGALKKIAPSGGRRENCWGISCEILFPILGEARAGCAPLWIRPCDTSIPASVYTSISEVTPPLHV